MASVPSRPGNAHGLHGLQLLGDDGVAPRYALRNVLILYSYGEGPADLDGALNDWHRMIATHGRFLFWMVSSAGRRRLGTGRSRIQENARRTSRHVIAQATSILGAGFFASAAIATASAMASAIPSRHPHRIFRDVTSTPAWIEAQLRRAGHDTDECQLAAAIAAITTCHSLHKAG